MINNVDINSDIKKKIEEHINTTNQNHIREDSP